MEEWEKLGISRRAYFYQKSGGKSATASAKVQSEIAPVQPEVQEDIVFDGTNGNMCKEITRADIERVLAKNPNAFIPNWYTAGHERRG